jgi:uncharacterized membrane protein YidH (DUF202 family)
MENTTPKIPWIRMAVALLLASFDFAVLIPSLGRVVVDHSTYPPTHSVQDLPQLIAILVAILLAGVAGVYFGARHLRVCWLEAVGWIILVGTLLVAMSE